MKLEHKNISKEMCKDSGLALVLICMICFQVWKHQFLILLAIAFLLVAMTYPPIIKPFARLWFGLSAALGTVVSRIILTIVFLPLFLPVGLMRRMLGKDAMKIKLWKKDNTSVFRRRDHRFSAKDLEHPY